MKRSAYSQPSVTFNGTTAPRLAKKELNLVLLYEDTQTRKWVREIYEKATKQAGAAPVRATWWKLSDLAAPGVLAGAVSTAMRADKIVVCTRAAEGLPLPFYVWVNAWMPHRVPASGELLGLLGVPTPPSPPSGRIREYLQAEASRTRMRFMLEERTLPEEPVNGESETIIQGRKSLFQLFRF
jgi:hypothetical protein